MSSYCFNSRIANNSLRDVPLVTTRGAESPALPFSLLFHRWRFRVPPMELCSSPDCSVSPEAF